MLFEDGIYLVSEESKIIDLHGVNIKSWLIFTCLENFFEAQGPWEDGLVQRFKTFNGSFEFLVSYQIVFILLFWSPVHIVIIFFVLAIFAICLFVLHFNLKVLFLTEMIDHTHYKVKIVLSFVVSHKVVKCCTIQINSCALNCKNPLYSLKHAEDVFRCHALIIVIIAQFKQKFELLVICYPGQ